MITCELCGEQLPDAAAAWDHADDCPVIRRRERAKRAREKPRRPDHRTIAHHVERHPTNDWRRRLITWGTRQALGPDATVYDALGRMKPKRTAKIAERIRKINRDEMERRRE